MSKFVTKEELISILEDVCVAIDHGESNEIRHAMVKLSVDEEIDSWLAVDDDCEEDEETHD